MIECLKHSFLYSEKKPRDYIFRAIESVLQDRAEPVILAKLRRDAALRAQHTAGTFLTNVNWDIAAAAVTNAMLHAQVLLSPNGTPVTADIASQAARVAELVPDYRDLTEAFLLEHIIRSLGDVSPRDHKMLAHVLFRQFDRSISMEDSEDRVAILIATLSSSVSLSPNGRYAVKAAATPDGIWLKP